MSSSSRSSMRLLVSSLLLVAALSVGLAALTGCGVSADQLAGPGQVQGAAITGVVHGGQQPVSGSQVYLFAASSAGYGASAVNLLTTGGIGVTPGGKYGNYVTTNAQGGFTLTGQYTCTAGSIIYMLSEGGNPGLQSGTNNQALALMSVLGPCPSGGFSNSFHVVINEETTVAGVYALSGFLTGPGSLGYPSESSGLALTGLNNAAANAGQLVMLSAGTALTTTPGGNGQVPTATINTLADILAACVNSDGSLTQTVSGVTTPTACGNLFQYATVGGVAPTETLTAMLNIAHNPAVNVAGLFSILPANPPFQPTLTKQPNDWTLSIAYGSNLQGVSATASAGVPAVDALGQVWFPTQVTLVQAGTTAYVSVLQGLTPLGETISNVDILDGSTSALSDITVPYQAAIDANGNVWGAINSYGFVARYDPVNDAPYTFFYNPGSNDDGHQLAIGADSNVYVSDYTMGQTFKMNLNGALQTFASTPGTDYGVALTQPGNAVMGYSDAGGPTPDKIAETNSAGGAVTTPANAALAGPITLPGNAVPNSFAADGNGKVWITDGNNDLFAYTESTVNASGSNVSKYNGGGLQSNTAAWPVVWLAVDGGGNVWVPNYGSTAIPGNIAEFSNSGTPITPSTGYIGSTACSPQGLAIDGSGDVWVSCATSTQPVLEFIGAAVPVHTPLTPGYFGTRP